MGTVTCGDMKDVLWSSVEKPDLLCAFQAVEDGPIMFWAVSPNLLWQVIHFLNTVSPAAISPERPLPPRPRRDNPSETVFVILLGPFLSSALL